MKSRDTENPHNRFRKVAVEYDEGDGPPPSPVTLIDDHARSILSENDSPDLGFKFSANPYRGCQHACAYCLGGDTQILMADSRTKRLAEVVVGDEIIGTHDDGATRRHVRTRVVDHWRTNKVAYRVDLAGGVSVITSGDHRLLGERGWAYVSPRDRHLRALRIDESLVGDVKSLAVGARGLVEPASQLRVRAIDELGPRELFDITTGTGDFIANGVVSHNCYARPTHEYLDLGAGTDFDTKIVVKREAPELLRAAFDKPSWKGDTVMFSGVTDCYQPVEKDLELTRRCLEVCLEYKNPVNVITKSALVERDIDLFLALAKEARFHLSVSLAFTDNDLSRAIEPWAASPDRRFKVIETMAKAGVSVGVMCAPIIPGVNDNQLVTLLERAAAAGATSAGWSLLRLPGAVKEVFEDRIRVALPLAGDKILHRIRDTRGGKLYDARFHTRGRGEGPYAEMIATMFTTTATRLGLTSRHDDHDEDAEPTTFQRPPKTTNQLSLF
ncbi:MAG: radical SAM protein [Deltaproteobacteria bacterium]|nr:radical SAM protein [Deltaproteobacteria bacterium]